MRLRRYRTEDLPILARLFGETVRQVNCRDYTLPQVEAWAAGEADLLARDSWFQRLYTLVAEADGLVRPPTRRIRLHSVYFDHKIAIRIQNLPSSAPRLASPGAVWYDER